MLLPKHLFICIFHRRKRLVELKGAGLDLLNVSLDTLVPQKFEFVSRRPKAAHAKVRLSAPRSDRQEGRDSNLQLIHKRPHHIFLHSVTLQSSVSRLSLHLLRITILCRSFCILSHFFLFCLYYWKNILTATKYKTKLNIVIHIIVYTGFICYRGCSGHGVHSTKGLTFL